MKLLDTLTVFLGSYRVTLIASAVSLALGFGGGYYVAVGQAERNAARGNGQTVQAQKDHDDRLHKNSNVVSDAAADRRVASDVKVEKIVLRIPEIVLVDKDCNFTSDAIHQLNEAGK